MQTFAMNGYFSLQLLGPGTGILLSHLDVLCSRTFLDPRGGVDLFPIVQRAHSQAPSTQHTHTHTWSSQPPGKQNFCSQFKGEETSLGDPVSRLRQLSQLGAELEYKPECSDFNSCSSSFSVCVTDCVLCSPLVYYTLLTRSVHVTRREITE